MASPPGLQLESPGADQKKGSGASQREMGVTTPALKSSYRQPCDRSRFLHYTLSHWNFILFTFSVVYMVRGTKRTRSSHSLCLYFNFGGTELRTRSPKSLLWQTLPHPNTSLTTGEWNPLLNTALSLPLPWLLDDP